MIWNFYPQKEFEHLSLTGMLSWNEGEMEAEFTVRGANPQYPLRIYGVNGEEQYYLGLMIPKNEIMYLNIKRPCPVFKELFLCIGRTEETYILVAKGRAPEEKELQIQIEDAVKQKGELKNNQEDDSWEKMTEPEKETEAQKFLFAHPSTRANLKFYGHYCKKTSKEEVYYAFASSFGPHPLPHLAKFSCWYDIDFHFGYQGYFIIGLRGEEFFLPKLFEEETEHAI